MKTDKIFKEDYKQAIEMVKNGSENLIHISLTNGQIPIYRKILQKEKEYTDLDYELNILTYESYITLHKALFILDRSLDYIINK